MKLRLARLARRFRRLPLKMSASRHSAPNDPAFVETLNNNCPSNCSGVAMVVDPISGIKTVEFAFFTSGSTAIANVTSGDVEVLEPGGSTVGDLIRFEDITNSQGDDRSRFYLLQ
jgi:hypothetical protein